MDERSETSDRRTVARYYDRLAAVYGDGELFGARRAAVLAAIADEIARTRRVLDLGCGNGAFAVEFATRAPNSHVVGMDLSPGMVQAAQRRLHRCADFLRGDASALPFRSGTFDIVFMSHVLMLVPNMERCVADISKCLVPGGQLIATIGMGGWRAALGPAAGASSITRSLLRRGSGQGWSLQTAASDRLLATLLRLRSLFGARNLRTFDDERRAGAACRAAGLEPEMRRAPFCVGGHALEEWIQIRWLTTFPAPLRLLARLLLPAVRWRVAGRTVQLAETVLIATKGLRPASRL
jgi:SAM-dependent methyltransferase